MSGNEQRVKDTPCPLAPAEAVNSQNDPRFAAFIRQGSGLLNELRRASEQHTRPVHFDAERTCSELAYVARLYFRFEESRKRAAERKTERPLTDLATNLRLALDLVQKVDKNGGFGALLREWHKGAAPGDYLNQVVAEVKKLDPDAVIPMHCEANMALASALSFDPSTGSTRIVDELVNALRTVAKLAAATNRAANHERSKAGRPKGPSKLPRADVIIGLAAVYRRATMVRPATTKDGPFFKFARKALFALGYRDINPNSLTNAIKGARRTAKRHSSASNKPSPFA
jgi:hypothetical protein